MKRFRRLRVNSSMRRMVRETRLDAAEFVYPIFVAEGENIKNPVDSMPDVYQYSIDRLEEILSQISESGISGILIFGIPEHKDALGTEAYNDEGITQRAVRYIKQHYPDLLIIADVCLCEYTDHGHCGVIDGDRILNDETLPLLCRMSVSLAKAGADIITVHVEACKDVVATLEKIKKCGVKAAITLNPPTPVSAIEPYLDKVDMVLVMSVNPGFGGQKFIPESLDKVKEIRKLLDAKGLDTDIEIDGGVNAGNLASVLEAGANVIVAGSAIFSGDVADNVKKFKEIMGAW